MVQQDVEPHLVSAPVILQVDEFLDASELLSLERASPQCTQRSLMVGLRVEQIEHSHSDLRPSSEQALEFILSSAIHRQPAIA